MSVLHRCVSELPPKGLTTTPKRNRNASPFQWKIHGLLFKVLDRENEPTNFQEMLLN